MSSPSGLRIVMVTCGQHLAAGARIPFLPGQPPTYEVKLSDLAGRIVQDGALPDAARTTLLGQLRVVVLSRRSIPYCGPSPWPEFVPRWVPFEKDPPPCEENVQCTYSTSAPVCKHDATTFMGSIRPDHQEWPVSAPV